MTEVHENDTCLACNVASELALCLRCCVKAWLKQITDRKQGCKAVELATLVAQEIAQSPISFPTFDIPALIEELVVSGDLVEVEYVLPNMDYRIKSFILPKGTEVQIDLSMGS